ncbi:hypothetical protein [Leptolyngbya sp. O-77]|uniref:hypothetical protein n=1 Tax=Leptolyngbya sp. O-77 TaxID=1080068 RepID=UPI000A9B5813|nr:hypothetical protein [Leptolyngbya sp. O-77]
MATSTVGFFSPFLGLPMQPLVAEVGDVSTDSRFTATPVRQDVAKASGATPREAARCQAGRSIDDLCLVGQAGRSPSGSLLSWRNVQFIAPRLLGAIARPQSFVVLSRLTVPLRPNRRSLPALLRLPGSWCVRLRLLLWERNRFSSNVWTFPKRLRKHRQA